MNDYKEKINGLSSCFRLEPRSRITDLGPGLRAAVADPLWMLARQWQSGEFKGENAGSPIGVELDYASHALTKVNLTGMSAEPENLGNTPLENLVEREYLAIDWRTSVRIGQQFEKQLRNLNLIGIDSILQFYRNNFPVTLSRMPQERAKVDYDSRQFIEFMAGKVVNGRDLLEENEKNGQRLKNLPAGLSKAQLKATLDPLLDWCKKSNIRLNPQTPKAWRNEQLDYRFQVGGDRSNGKGLAAPSYQNGNLEWYQFNADPDTPNVAWINQPTIKSAPTRLKIRGTAYRWWEFEDASADYGHLENVQVTDQAKLLLMEFALIYGDDWYTMTIPMEMGRLVRINEIRVTNAFGETADGLVPAQVLSSDPLKRWEVFTLSPIPGGQSELSSADAPGIQVFDQAKYLELSGQQIQLSKQMKQFPLTKSSQAKLALSLQATTTQLQQMEKDRRSILFIPPVAGFREESAPLEEIRFLRDEGANMIWAVENTLLNGLGYPVGGFDLHSERNERERQAEIELARSAITALEGQLNKPNLQGKIRENLTGQIQVLELRLQDLEKHRPVEGVPLYRLATSVPDHWIPFVPVDATQHLSYTGIRLRRALMLRNEEDRLATSIPAMSALLGPDGDDNSLLWLEEPTVPRSGRRLQLTAQRMRWTDGKTYTWIGRKVLTGKGEGSSGLRFDGLK